MNITTQSEQYGAAEVNQAGAVPVPGAGLMPAVTPMRTYKDRVFRMLFKEKESFLELYNALNDTDYDNPESLIVTTLENAIYIGMKNDVSYLLYDQLAIYEHQSTWNPNLPLRELFYVSSIYSGLTRDSNLHGTRLIHIPEPKFVVFYNGRDEKPERSVILLSDAYEHTADHPSLELETLVLNINPGYNEKLKKKCRMLYEYTVFVSRVREYSGSLPFGQAVEKATDDCIAGGILRDFLLKNRAEVISVSIFEYNEELHMQQERADAMEEGIQRGIEQGIRQGIQQGVQQGIRQGIQQGVQQGIRQGIWQNNIYLIQKNRSKGRSPEEITDMLETELSFVNTIISLANAYPEADSEELYTLWMAQKE